MKHVPPLPLRCLCLALLCLTLTQPATAQSGRELRYRGKLESVDQRGNHQPVDEFSLLVIIDGEPGTARTGYFAVTEDTGDRLPWHERLGQQRQQATSELSTGDSIQFGYRHNDRLRNVTLVPLFVPHEGPLTEGMRWMVDGKDHTVEGTTRVAGNECWQIEVPDRLGRWQKLAVDKETDIVLAARRRLFMGQGDRFELSVELESQKDLDAAALDAVRKPLTTLLALKKTTDDSDTEESPQADPLKQLTAQAAGTSLADFATLVQRELKANEQRPALSPNWPTATSVPPSRSSNCSSSAAGPMTSRPGQTRRLSCTSGSTATSRSNSRTGKSATSTSSPTVSTPTTSSSWESPSIPG